MEITVNDTAHAAWVEQVKYDLEYALGEVRATLQQVGSGGTLTAAQWDVYWRRTDYLFQQCVAHLAAIHESLEGGEEYAPPAATVP